jgi:hypothetical protein
MVVFYVGLIIGIVLASALHTLAEYYEKVHREAIKQAVEKELAKFKKR